MAGYSSTYLHTAISRIFDQVQFDAQKLDLDRALDEAPELLLKLDANNDNPLWFAVKQNNSLMVEYLLLKFSEKYQILTAGHPHLFRTFFMQLGENKRYSSVYDYANGLIQPNYLILAHLQTYGADLYSPKPLVAVNKLFTEGRLDNTAYWTAFSRERVKQHVGVHKTQKLACLDYLNLRAPQLVPPQLIEQHDQQLRELVSYLQSESNEFERLIEAQDHTFMNTRVRPAIEEVADYDIQNLDQERWYQIEKIFLLGLAVGFVFWSMYNHEVHMIRNGKADALKNLTSYDDCSGYQVESELHPGRMYNVTFAGMDRCTVAKYKFSDECKADKTFWNAYEDCYSTSLKFIFQSMALAAGGMYIAIIGIMILQELLGSLTPHLALVQEMVKSPVYLTRSLVGEQTDLRSVPSKWSRVAVYKQLISLLQTIFTEGEAYESLRAQRVILNKWNHQITAAELQTVVDELVKYFNEYGHQRNEGFASIDPAQLAPTLKRLAGIAKHNAADPEGALATLSPGLKRPATERSRLLN